MIDFLGFTMLLLLAVGVGVLGAREFYVRRRPQREARLMAELEALRATQRLSLAAWAARQAMREMADPPPSDLP